MTAELVYEILKHHKLLPDSVSMAATVCNSIASDGSHFEIRDDDSDLVANIFISGVIPGETCQLDIVPVTKFFRTGFDDPLRDAALPLLQSLFTAFDLRRITSVVPASRTRSKRALATLGFVPEGRLRDGIVLWGRPPEDLRILGLLRSDIAEEEEHGIAV